jgi:2-iminobutanoate/2-iminopropanoate deaminase
MDIQAIRVDDAPAPIAPYSQGIRAGDFLFVSGQGPVDPKTGQVVVGSIEVQTARVMENIAAILHGAGATFGNVVKCNMYLRDIDDFAAASKVYGSYLGAPQPARTCIQAADLPLHIAVEVEAIAYIPK